MTKRLLNLDALIPEPAAVLLNETEYPIAVRSVEAWLSFMKRRDELESMTEALESGDTVKLIENNVDVVAMACPSIPKKDLMALPLPALMELVKFIGEEMTAGLEMPGDEEGAPEAESEGEAEVG